MKLDRRRVVDEDVAVTGLRCMDCLGTSFASFFYKMQNRQMECQKKMCNIVLPRFKIVKPVLSILKKIMSHASSRAINVRINYWWIQFPFFLFFFI